MIDAHPAPPVALEAEYRRDLLETVTTEAALRARFPRATEVEHTDEATLRVYALGAGVLAAVCTDCGRVFEYLPWQREGTRCPGCRARAERALATLLDQLATLAPALDTLTDQDLARLGRRLETTRHALHDTLARRPPG
ncbi:zinc ribbon domain-containing protein [Marichromatium gracile]|uniref:zinc ribbon domain-containing protein n=1 Tax=Marichromatium gracile TaxID=1048 RepID=UPI001F352E37|nr:zinc ribbon domain-containing protein [Marichromatium gracile]MCF1183743.1 zinc ribbon domain-containing protein [Marichromatium gracile]